MKRNILLCSAFLVLASTLAYAGPVLLTGTPGDDLLSTPTGPSPNLGGLLLTFATFPGTGSYDTAGSPGPFVQNGVTISSPDGLTVEPFSTQSNPNFLADGGTGGDGDGSANTTISLANGTTALGVGIADSDDLTLIGQPSNPVNITLQALGLGGVDLGSPFTVNISETTINPGNGYFVVEDTTADIFGLQIVAPATDESGLAIADVQVAPEPSSWLLLTAGVAVLGSFRPRKRA